MVSTIRESQYSQMFFFEDFRANNFFFKQFFSGAFIAIVMTGLDQDMMQKNNSCRNLGEAQKNMFSFCIILVIVNLVFVSLGALLYIFAETKGISIPPKTDYLFPTLAIEHFSAIAGITFIIGLIAAAYSSADSALTSLTTSFCVDFLNFEKKPETKDRKRLIKTRYTVHVGFSLLLLAVILSFKYLIKDDVITELFKIAGYTYGPLLGLYAFGLFTKLKIKDKLVLIPCLLSPLICYGLNLHAIKNEWVYKFGFELLILNGLLTFIGLLLISKRK